MSSPSPILDRSMSDTRNVAAELVERVSREALVRTGEPLAKRTTLRVGGPADMYVEPATEEDLAAVL